MDTDDHVDTTAVYGGKLFQQNNEMQVSHVDVIAVYGLNGILQRMFTPLKSQL